MSATDRIREPLPQLIIEYPKCGNCYEEVDIEDGLPSCPRCLIQWDDIADDAEAEIDPHAELSGETCGHKPSPRISGGIDELPCSLPVEHTRSHHYPWKART